MHGNEAGEINYETRHKVNNEWIYEDRRHQLQHGDFLSFWIYVQHDNSEYRLVNQRYSYPGLNIKS